MFESKILDLIENFEVKELSSFALSKTKILAFLTGIGLSSFAYKTIQIYLLRRRYRHIPGPETKGILGFYLGNSSDVVDSRKNGMYPDLVVEWIREYGNVIKYQIGDKMFLFTVDTDAIREMFVTKNFPKPKESTRVFGFPLDYRFLGNGLLTELDNDRWKYRRHVFNPSFSKKALENYADEFDNKGERLMERLRTIADGKTICFGMQIDSITSKNELKTYLAESLIKFNEVLVDPTIKFTLSGRLMMWRYKSILNNLRELGRSQILKRIKHMKEGGHLIDDFLTTMIKNYQNSDFVIEDMIDEFVTFFITGQETTANLMAALVLELGQRPEILKKVKDEIDFEIGSKRTIGCEDVQKLKYLNSVIKETLRVWSVIPFLGRTNDVPFKIGKYDIPIGSDILTCSYVSGKMEEFFPNPLEFDPERFHSNKHEIKNYTYFPFGMGTRICIGMNFSQIETKVLMVKLIQNFDFKLDPTQSFKPVQNSTIGPADRVRCTLTFRNA
nr:cytochrome P450 3049B1-3 [Brachionus rubens]